MPRAIIRRIPSTISARVKPRALKIGVAADRFEQPAARHRIDPVNQKGGAATIRRDDDQFALDLEAGRAHHAQIFVRRPA